MATLEDKILGEKLQYYCSSSSEDEENGLADDAPQEKIVQTSSQYAPGSSSWNGISSNTGPKGVIKDWQRFKQIEAKKRTDSEKEHLLLIKKLSLTCQYTLKEEKDTLMESDSELAELLADEFLLNYQKQRMKEMLENVRRLKFGNVIYLESADDFLTAIDKENKSVTIIIHIYEKSVPGCEAMNGCLQTLAQEYPFVKFCKILGSVAGLSNRFKEEGVPALLSYKGGQLVGNFVHLTDTLGEDFYSTDVENFLIEHGMLNDKNNVPPIIKKTHEWGVSDSD
ncbi:phosducin-like protein [Orussus abietinus]|uniref:phosducin-like protein n=1 Tax=Orussus abietinus TaxID=222816 RepID=UPI000625B886|nr:phosducin-like protein [Orussus abietinus]XP_012272795.1 phosducin-like protein [Orussus abietinus]